MDSSTIAALWQEPGLAARFHSGVCLHGHTMYSEECLWFLPRYLHAVPGISQAIRAYERGREPVDYSRAYWTPPLTPACALRTEQVPIAFLGLRPLVSLTDHDNIEAGMGLQISHNSAEVPVSVEWTVPYEGSILHLGIHNLPPSSARSWMSVMAAYTKAPSESSLPEILDGLVRIPETLVVWNHPFWLEEGVTQPAHERAISRVLRECVSCLHAFEINGTRPWSENRRVIKLADQWDRPAISGGDRHACEPAACLNLTNATTFAEFVAEIRSGYSSVLLMPQYRESLVARFMEAMWDIIRPYPDYAGRELWTDRFFYRSEDAVARPLSAIWKGRVPWIVRPAAALVEFTAIPGMRSTLRHLLARQGELLQ